MFKINPKTDEADNLNHNDDHSELGSVEAGLTFIPTTAFFLLVMQLVISGSFQVVETMNLQSAVTKYAFSQEWNLRDHEPKQRDLNVSYEELPGGGALILADSQITTPQITNLIRTGPKMKSQALAITE